MSAVFISHLLFFKLSPCFTQNMFIQNKLSPKPATEEEQQLRDKLAAEVPDISYVIAEIYVR